MPLFRIIMLLFSEVLAKHVLLLAAAPNVYGAMNRILKCLPSPFSVHGNCCISRRYATKPKCVWRWSFFFCALKYKRRYVGRCKEHKTRLGQPVLRHRQQADCIGLTKTGPIVSSLYGYSRVVEVCVEALTRVSIKPSAWNRTSSSSRSESCL